MLGSIRVIDADGHIVEPVDIWERYLEKEYRALAPQLVYDEHGFERVKVEGRLIGKTAGGFSIGAAMRPRNLSALSADERRRIPYTDAQPGATDPHIRVKDLDTDGIDAAVLYPTMGLFFGGVRDPELGAALCRAYNNWLADYCRPYPDRLIGIGAIHPLNVESAVKELRRVVTDLKFRGVFLRPNPYGGRNFDSPDYDPLWAAAQDLDVPIAIHEGTTADMPTAGIDRYAYFEDPASRHFFSHIVSHCFEEKLACLTFTCGGVLEKFPRLRVIFLESGGGWLPHWLYRMDEHYEKLAFEVPWLKRKPSEYFKRSCFISFDPDEESLPMAAKLVSEDCVMWATDYPHFDGKFPGSTNYIRDTKAVSDSLKKKLLQDNPSRAYGLS